MKIGAVVCEYNPFHLGHQYQLETARRELKLDAIVGIMSGNFVQRGDVAIYPKELRARTALACGIDLVLELPAVLTLQSAERYARNAVLTLNALGCVDTLFFGAECTDIDLLKRIAKTIVAEDAPFQEQLKAGLAKGLSFAGARAEAIRIIIGNASAEFLSQPNNILGVEYLKALLRSGSKIKPVALARKGANHNDTSSKEGFASASLIREQMLAGESYQGYLPQKSLALYAGHSPASLKSMEQAILSRICLMPRAELARIADVAEGLENAICREALTADNLNALIDGVKSKRYAYSRIRRILLNAYLGITKQDADLTPSYIRILDFNEKGREILNLARKTATLPLAKHGGQIKEHPAALALWQRELAIGRVYRLFFEDKFTEKEIVECE
ncbi:MAG: nucleotidyltransferase family protein [Clostridia bacterium]|nr:nucleotidyltransferase family protein [Clostridia bacterium]